ncbi:nuclear transport factor 2 family protein [Aurantiacibacter sediminis]|uniref:Nuclear transport factor 2 family protein n=1 Tax=Aurantiacibacter sediminis TaxID=2793064 RepID=A0ABS0N040_9SPHN|nr:nuclear transport factor 2 family protein [Aurantiacibacter sediminis]MBH5321330.1 nuclear transport factor 2 family protein [Aurantiacibacter sediminis]
MARTDRSSLQQSGRPVTAEDSGGQGSRQTIERMIEGFAKQDIDSIMALIADDAVYCDVLGEGPRGDEYHGKEAIRGAFIRQFAMAGPHTYVGASILLNDDAAFASWTMVLGEASDPTAPRFEGIDEFRLNAGGQVTLKKAWLKGQPRLRRLLMRRNPGALLRHWRYVLRVLRS